MGELELGIQQGEGEPASIRYTEAINSLVLSLLLGVPERTVMEAAVGLGIEGLPDAVPPEENAHLSIPVERAVDVLQAMKNAEGPGSNITFFGGNFRIMAPKMVISVRYIDKDRSP
ncbi:hypothetical protein HY948_04250 [Candidatus Gottesmanbacteria bacterium]|nr:hypothetical protein [Candidatus Gottesmanbacteria bacterium]